MVCSVADPSADVDRNLDGEAPAPTTVIVTGGAGGLGVAITEALLRDGCRVAIVDIDGDCVLETTSRLAADGCVLGLTCDITDEQAVADAVDETVSAWGRLDVVVNNAGIEIPIDLEHMDMDVWDRTFAVNVKAPMSFIKHAIPHWRRQRSGCVVSVGSRTWMSGSSPAPYVASKAALVGLTRRVAVELGPIGVTANVVAPSFVRTALSAAKGDDAAVDRFAARFVEFSPLRRLVQPEDVANAVAFLASSGARNITGEILNVAAGSQIPPSAD
jgi:3-oxoacyl-[acyl-carrier protein] reductase